MVYPIWTYYLFYLAYARPRVPTIRCIPTNISISGNKSDEVRRFAEPRRMICDAVSSRLKLDEFLDLLLKSFFGLCAGKTKVTHLLTVLEEKNGGD